MPGRTGPPSACLWRHPPIITRPSGLEAAEPAKLARSVWWRSLSPRLISGPTVTYSATAQSNHAAQNLRSHGRTLHAATGLLMPDSLQTARLRLNPQTQKKMDRLAGNLGVEVIDELGRGPADFLRADALCKTRSRCLCPNLDATNYLEGPRGC